MPRDLPGARPLAAAADQRVGPGARSPRDYRQFLQRFGAVIERFRADARVHDPAQCFVVRTLLIHAYRRVLLRDPLLPAALLPLDWPGAAAYALCRDFYRLTHRSRRARTSRRPSPAKATRGLPPTPSSTRASAALPPADTARGSPRPARR